MAKPEELPTGTKALQKMVEDLRLELAQAQQKAAADAHAHEQAIERLVEGHEAALEAAAAVARDASEASARAVSAVHEMSTNRDTWVARVDRAQALAVDLVNALAGLDGEGEPSTEGEETEPIPLPAAPEPKVSTTEG